MSTRLNPFEKSSAPEPRKPTRKGARRRKRSKEAGVSAQDALARIENSQSVANYGHVIAAFQKRGIPAEEIHPKENVFTFTEWPAKGRHVRKGEKGVSVVTWIPTKSKQSDENGEPIMRTRPVRSSLFHISQTDPNNDRPSQAPLSSPSTRTSQPTHETTDDDLPSWLNQD